jgi:NADH dehydrogenase/NADH:ubiquinone oxidoreductase subunit G
LSLVGPILETLQKGVKAKTSPDIAAAVSALSGQGPAALLAHPSLVPGGRQQLEALAKALGASGETGMLGAPLPGANGRGAMELAPDVYRADANRVLASNALLAIGDEAWGEMPGGSYSKLVLATSQPVPDHARVEVVLPMAHAYERQATITNLEGRIQHQEGGAAPPPHARSDFSIVAGLAQRLGAPGPSPESVDLIREFIANEHPAFAEALMLEEALVARV